MKPRISHYITLFLGLLSIFSVIKIQAQSGLPYLKNYSPKQYKAEAQNWAIVQDQRGVMYFGNTVGVLEYDGVNWRLIRVANNSGCRSLAVDNAGKVWVGSLDDFGYLGVDSLGGTVYHSLLNMVKSGDRQFADVWKIHALKDKVVFQTFTTLFWLKNDVLHVRKAEIKYRLSFKFKDNCYVEEEKKGLLIFKGDSLSLIPGGQVFAGSAKAIATMLPFGFDKAGNQNILMPTSWGEGSYIFNGKEVNPIILPSDSFLNNSVVYNGAQISEARFALGTIKAGVGIIDRSGNLFSILNKSVGLQDEMVIYSFVDDENALWLGLNNGISRVETNSPITYLTDYFDLQGSVESVIRHKGELHIATNLGVFKLENQSPEKYRNSELAYIPNRYWKFVQLPNLDVQSWSLLSVGDALLAGTNRAVYKFEKGESELVLDSKSFYLYRSKVDSNRVFIGLLDGLAAIYYDNGKWVDEGKVEGITEQVRSCAESSDGSLWLGTLYQGVLKIKFPKVYKYKEKIEESNSVKIEIEPEHIARFDSTYGLPGGEIGVFDGGDDLAIATTKGIFRARRNLNGKVLFYADSVLGVNETFNYPAISRIYTDFDKNVWIRAGDITGVSLRKKNGTYRFHYRPFLRIPEGSVWSYFTEPSGRTWIGGDNGLIRYDGNVIKNYARKYFTLIRKVYIGRDSVVFKGNFANESGVPIPAQPLSSIPNFKFEFNSLRFEYAALNFDSEEFNQYQYFLEGFDKEYSNWSYEHKKEYTNLPEGKYTFKVKARNIFQSESEEAIYKFEIEPPFYKTWWFFGGQLGFIFMLFGASFYFSRSAKAGSKLPMVLTTISLIIVFEYVQNFVEDNFSDFLGGIAFFKVLLNVILATLLFPIENFVKKIIEKRAIAAHQKMMDEQSLEIIINKDNKKKNPDTNSEKLIDPNSKKESLENDHDKDQGT